MEVGTKFVLDDVVYEVQNFNKVIAVRMSKYPKKDPFNRHIHIKDKIIFNNEEYDVNVRSSLFPSLYSYNIKITFDEGHLNKLRMFSNEFHTKRFIVDNNYVFFIYPRDDIWDYDSLYIAHINPDVNYLVIPNNIIISELNYFSDEAKNNFKQNIKSVIYKNKKLLINNGKVYKIF